jgi:NAD(P)H-flavin reductase
MTQHLNDMQIGESIDFRGPFGKLKYLGDGHFEQLVKFNKPLESKHFKKLIMLSGGTGITPMYQMIQAVYQNDDNTEILLIFGNKSTKDFLLKEELDDIIKSGKKNIKVIFTIDRPEEGWSGDVGFITKDMIKKYSDDYAHDSTFVMACGPPIMVNGLKKAVKEMGVKDDNFYNF